MLVSKGHSLVKVKKLGVADVIWYFDDTKAINELITKFSQGKVELNITNYLYQRMVLKRLSTFEPLPIKTGDDIKAIRPGMLYYFIQNGKVYENLYGKAPLHQERIDAGNFYATRAAAIRALKSPTK